MASILTPHRNSQAIRVIRAVVLALLVMLASARLAPHAAPLTTTSSRSIVGAATHMPMTLANGPLSPQGCGAVTAGCY